MQPITLESSLIPVILTAVINVGVRTNTLVKDNTNLPATNTSQCPGNEWTDFSLALLTIPILAFLLPHEDLHDIKAGNYLKRCGRDTQPINREAVVGRGVCISALLTFPVTHGIWQWYPAHASWETDVRP